MDQYLVTFIEVKLLVVFIKSTSQYVYLHLIFNDLLKFILKFDFMSILMFKFRFDFNFIIQQFIYFRHFIPIIFLIYWTICPFLYICYMQLNYQLNHLIFLNQLNVLRITINQLFKYLLALIIISNRNKLFQLHLDCKLHLHLYQDQQLILILSL